MLFGESDRGGVENQYSSGKKLKKTQSILCHLYQFFSEERYLNTWTEELCGQIWKLKSRGYIQVPCKKMLTLKIYFYWELLLWSVSLNIDFDKTRWDRFNVLDKFDRITQIGMNETEF